jgi:hypothetical protein
MGDFTLETVPGLKRHLRKAAIVALSSTGLPVLCHIETFVTLPELGSTLMATIPLPVIFCRLAS